MPPKARRATQWRHPSTKELFRPLRSIDVDGLWQEVKRLIPEFSKQPQAEQRLKIRMLAVKLAWMSAEAEAERTRPTSASMRRNVGELATTIRAVRNAQQVLDIDSKHHLSVAAGEPECVPRDDVVQKGNLRWAEFDSVLQNAERWADRALKMIPKRPSKRTSTRTLDDFVSSLVLLYQGDAVTPVRRITRSAKRGKFLDFVYAIAKFVPAFSVLSRHQLDGSIRRVLPILHEASYYAEFGRLPGNSAPKLGK
jgi:hypothetical protein